MTKQIEVLYGAKTHFSLGESIYKPVQLVDDAHELGYKGIAIADTMSINAVPQMSKRCEDLGMSLVVGCCFNVVDNIKYRKAKRGEPKTENPFFYLDLYAMNEEGMREIMSLLTLAHDPDHFYFKSQISQEEIREVIARGNVSALAGSLFSLFSHKQYTDIAKSLASACSRLRFDLAVSPVDSPYYDRVTLNAAQFHLDHPSETALIFSRPVLAPDDSAATRDTMNAILDKAKLNEPRVRHADETFYMWSPEEIIDWHSSHYYAGGKLAPIISESIVSSTNAILTTHYEWKDLPVSLPSSFDDPSAELAKMCSAGMKDIVTHEVFGYKPDKELYKLYVDRLKYELGVLNSMGFEDYFILVRNITNWCKEQNISVGPGRGSVGGSLVAFVLGITDVDPIRFNLIFERFINPERLDLPDIDLDFMSSRRQEVVDQLVAQFGQEKVAGITNYSVLGASSALRSVASASGLQEFEYRCSKTLTVAGIDDLLEAKDAIPEIEAYSRAHPKEFQLAVELQGTFRAYGKHAAGVVVADCDLSERAVLETRTGTQVINWDKRECEHMGLVKLDLLGLKNLDLLRLASNIIVERDPSNTISWTAIDLEDKLTLEAFAKGKTTGVFQFESGSAKKLLKEVAVAGPLSFEVISDITALNRPGPLESGLTQKYVNIKQGIEFPDYMHDALKPALEPTVSVIIFQEQVMQIARDLCGFSMAQADHLRKAMGKKDAAMMGSLRMEFISGAFDHSKMENEDANDLFDLIEKFAGYGFNKSHSIAYTLISFQTMYAKTHYPIEFYAAALTALGDDKLNHLIRDAKKAGIEVLPPDINISSDRYEIAEVNGKECLFAPFQAVKGLSEKGAAAIIQAKKDKGSDFEDMSDFIATVNRRACNVRVREALEKIGTFASITPGAVPANHISRLKDQKAMLPNVMLSNVKAERLIPTTSLEVGAVKKVMDEANACTKCDLESNPHVRPSFGVSSKIMIVMDAPNFSEESEMIMGRGKGCEFLEKALTYTGLNMGDIYLTALVKAKPAKGEKLDNGSINGCSQYLKREIEVLKPPVILTLGSKAARHLLPDLKGSWEEILMTDSYDPDSDATTVVGFNPMMIYHNPNLQDKLNEVMAHAHSMIKS